MSKVYLVGAGCGSLDLYTVKALELIQNADCLIYDRLVDPQVLTYTKPDCEQIYVGKQAGNHTLRQEEMNALLVEKAKVYETVVRLKGGDVYVFGRGGEEGLYLKDHGIDFEVVPGISSAIAGLAYAGIPITHRGISQGFHVYTAHSKDNTLSHMDFKTMLPDDQTYVFLMGLSQLPRIVEGLLTAGKASDTPIALISHASLPAQKTLVSTLAQVIADFNEHPLTSPVLIVVGKVVHLREKLNFFENKPLFGRSVLVTKIGEEPSIISLTARENGAAVKEIQTGTITYLDQPLPDLKQYHWLIFTSRHGVHGLFKQLKKQKVDLRQLAGCKMMTIGQKTSDALWEYGFCSDWMPQSANSLAMNQEINEQLQGSHSLLLKGNHPTSLKGFTDQLQVYTNTVTAIKSEETHYDYGCFSCASSVQRLHAATSIRFDCIISIGPKTSEAIRQCYPNTPIIEVRTTTKQAMVQAMLEDAQ